MFVKFLVCVIPFFFSLFLFYLDKQLLIEKMNGASFGVNMMSLSFFQLKLASQRKPKHPLFLPVAFAHPRITTPLLSRLTSK